MDLDIGQSNQIIAIGRSYEMTKKILPQQADCYLPENSDKSLMNLTSSTFSKTPYY